MSEMRNNVGEGWREINNNNGSTLEAGDQWRYAGSLPVDRVWSDIPNNWVGCIACNTEYRFRRRTATEKLGGEKGDQPPTTKTATVENVFDASDKEIHDKEVLCKKLMDEFDIFALNAEIDRLNKKIADMELTPFQVLRLKAAAIVLEDVPKPDWLTRLAKRLSTATIGYCSDWADEERLNIAWMLRDMAERMGGKNG